MIKPVSLACGHSAVAWSACTLSSLSPITPHQTQLRAQFAAKPFTFYCTSTSALVPLPEIWLCIVAILVAYESALEHARDHGKGCPKAVVKCRNVGCHHSSLREDMDAHSNSCEKALVDCPGCRNEVARSRLAEHQRRKCFYSKIDCPLGCGTKLPG